MRRGPTCVHHNHVIQTRALRLQEAGAEGHSVPLASSRWKVEGLDQGLLRVEGAVGSYLPGSGAGTCVCPAWLASFGTLSS